MTVSYQGKLATERKWLLLSFLLRWKGSIYQVLWADLLMFAILYTAMSLTYRLLLDDEARIVFSKICLYFDNHIKLIPVSFVLGFYVNVVMKRWWDQFLTIPWPDSVALLVTANINGRDDRSRIMRRTIIRYVNLGYILTFRKISIMVQKRFPTLKHLVDAGLLSDEEMNILEDYNQKTKSIYWWLPFAWAVGVVAQALEEKRIESDIARQSILNEINVFRSKCSLIQKYDWISVPLIYTQVVTWAVYFYFLACVLGRQFVMVPGNPVPMLDIYFPICTLLQFVIYMGWLKVAQVLMNPFGDDDDDFEINYLIDSNIQSSFMMVDQVHENYPDLKKDYYWDTFPIKVPYTEACKKSTGQPYSGSAEEAAAHVTKQQYDDPIMAEKEDNLRRRNLGFQEDPENGDIISEKGPFNNTIISTSI